jgi:hypothetical protein
MRFVKKGLVLAAIGLSLLGAAEGTAIARTKVEWSRVDVPAGESSARLGKVLRAALEQAARKANFGDAKSVTLSAKIVAFSAEQRGDVVRVSCTVMGRVKGGQGARSKISFGGSVAERTELEKQVLTMVANGLVARLAQIARAQAPERRESP